MSDLLQYIDRIDQQIGYAEINVLETMIRSYDKSIMILENCNSNMDISAFDIFQEGEKWEKFKEDSKAPVFGNKGESLGKRLLMIIPRIINALIKLVKTIIAKLKRRTAFEKLKEIPNVTKEDIEAYIDYLKKHPKKAEKYLKDFNRFRVDLKQEYVNNHDDNDIIIEAVGNATDWTARVGNINPEFDKNSRRISEEEAKKVHKVVQTSKSKNRFDELISVIENKTISSRYDFDKFIDFYEQLMIYFKQVDDLLKDAVKYIDNPPIGYKVNSAGNLITASDKKKLSDDMRIKTISTIASKIGAMDNLKGRYNIKYGEEIPSTFVSGWREKTLVSWDETAKKLKEVINKNTTSCWESIRDTLNSHPAFADNSTLVRDLCQQFTFVHKIFLAFYEEYIRVSAVANAAADLYSEYRAFKNMYPDRI